MKKRISFAMAALFAVIAMPNPGLAQDAEQATPTNLSEEDRHDVLCILTTNSRADRALERMAFFFGRIAARNPGSRFTPTLNTGMPFFRELDRREQDALSRACQDEFAAAFG